MFISTYWEGGDRELYSQVMLDRSKQFSISHEEEAYSLLVNLVNRAQIKFVSRTEADEILFSIGLQPNYKLIQSTLQHLLRLLCKFSVTETNFIATFCK